MPELTFARKIFSRFFLFFLGGGNVLHAPPYLTLFLFNGNETTQQLPDSASRASVELINHLNVISHWGAIHFQLLSVEITPSRYHRSHYSIR